MVVKVLQRDASPDVRSRFEYDQARLAELREHPDIVVTTAHGYTDANQPYLVMEELTGGSLADRVGSGMDGPGVIAIGVKLAGALESAHRRNLVHGDLRDPRSESLPPTMAQDDERLAQVRAMARDMVVCLGYTEQGDTDDVRHNAALCVTGDGVLGRHRKVHQPLGESLVHAAGDRFDAFDTPLGRLGMLIDYDKTFPESARALALDGAEVVACLSAWPASTTDPSAHSTTSDWWPSTWPGVGITCRPGSGSAEPSSGSNAVPSSRCSNV